MPPIIVAPLGDFRASDATYPGVRRVPSLFVIRGNDQGSRFELEDGTFRLGRDASSDIRLLDTEVSRQHAELRSRGGTCSISDLNSSNGTFVNGQRVRQRELSTGDQIQLGSTLMLFTGVIGESVEDLSSVVDIASRSNRETSRGSSVPSARRTAVVSLNWARRTSKTAGWPGRGAICR